MFTERFFQLFPPPSFLALPRVGVDISDEAIRFVEFVHFAHGLELGRFGEKKLPTGVVESGYINDIETLVGKLSELRHENDLNFVKASLPEEKVYLFKAELPRLPQSEMRSAIEFRLEENVPISPADAIFDYEVIQKELPEFAETVEVSISVLPKKVITTYLQVFERSGLSVLEFATEGKAISSSLIKKGDLGTYMIVNFTEKRTGIFIISEGVVRFTSTLTIGGELVTNALAKSLSISQEEAQKIKEEQRTVGKNGKDIFDYSMNALSAIKDEINKIFIYWHTHEDLHTAKSRPNNKIEKIILCGENSALIGLDAYLASSIKVPVERGDVWNNAFSYESFIPAIPALKALSYAVPIGLALPN